MTIDPNTFQLTELLQAAWYRMGQLQRWKATGGSTTTIINTLWAGVEEPTFEDDDPALIYGTAVVLHSTDGNAPEGEFGMITDYDSASQTLTMDAVGAAVGAGDKFGVASPLFPADDMIELANIALQRVADVEYIDLSITTVASQTEYVLPVYAGDVIRVRRQTLQASSNNQWVDIQGWYVIPSAPGVQDTLVLPLMSPGYGIEVTYRTRQAPLTAFDSVIDSRIHPELAVCALVAEAYQWYNDKVGGSNPYFTQRENKAIQDLEAAIVKYPIRKIVERVPGLPHWGSRGDYVPLTSDLKA